MSNRKTTKYIEIWNRKLHIYIGLYLLLFLWLFFITGLVKNHPEWSFFHYWENRELSSSETPIQVPMDKDDLVKARNIMAQLHISGEITWTVVTPMEDQFNFRVAKPGKIIDIKANLREGHAKVEQIKLNTLGITNMLHTFNGISMNDPKESRDWFMTKILSFLMDAVCIGLIFLVLSGIYTWYNRSMKRIWGALVLGIAFLVCGFFVFGLGWMP
ncbi:MAG: hypothetical protein AAB116_22440 [Candidatus Poribacteria bacterium]